MEEEGGKGVLTFALLVEWERDGANDGDAGGWAIIGLGDDGGLRRSWVKSNQCKDELDESLARVLTDLIGSASSNSLNQP